jgi:hypothetical protein
MGTKNVLRMLIVRVDRRITPAHAIPQTDRRGMMRNMMAYEGTFRWSIGIVGSIVMATTLPDKVESAGVLADASSARDVVLIQYRTTDQEYLERLDRYRREQDENQRIEHDHEQQRQDIKRRSTWGAIAYDPHSGRWGATHD